MKTKLVLWGTNEQNEKILIALELRPKQNIVDLWTFPESVASDEFAQNLLNNWRNGVEVPFPEEKIHFERELTLTDGLLPDHLKVERGDIVQRALTEWHFVVLSAKLNQVYQTELNEFKEKIEQLDAFDSDLWNNLKSFWSKIQTQIRDRNLFREHANNLRDNTNELFSKMKELRSALDEEFKTLSKNHFEDFMTTLKEIEEKITEGKRLNAVFDDLKGIQRKFRDTKFTKEHRAAVWEKLDGAFKAVKEKRFGPNANRQSTPLDRLKRRYDGLIGAIEKMERSIGRDREDLDFQDRKIARSDGQLEAQIRQAKIKMIHERIRSKEEKLGEMVKTKEELESRMEVEQAKEAKRVEQEKVKAAQKAAKEKIAEKIKLAEKARSEQTKDPDQTSNTPIIKIPASAAEASQDVEVQAEAVTLDSVAETVGHAFDNAVDTVKAVAEVVENRVQKAVSKVQHQKVSAEEEE